MKKRTTKRAAASKKRVASKAKRVVKRATKSTAAKRRAKNARVARKSVFSFWAE